MGGSAGADAAGLAARLGARALIVERDRIGGDCTWTGCVPSKALIAAARAAHDARQAGRFGIRLPEPDVDRASVMAHVRATIETVAAKDTDEDIRRSGVGLLKGSASLAGPGVVEVDGRRLGARRVLIATGSTPAIPAVPGLAESDPLTTDTLWSLRELPARLAILGGGPVGCELGQALQRLGVQVCLVETASRLLPEHEPRVGELLSERLRAEGVDVRTATTATRFSASGAGAGEMTLACGGATRRAPYDRVLVVTGRRPGTEGVGLETAGVAQGPRGAILVDERLRTTARGVFAIGDVTGILPTTQTATYQARIAVPNALFGRRRRASYRALPRVVFTDPAVGRVGLTAGEARERWGRRAVVVDADLGDLDAAIVTGRPHGFARLVGDHRGRLVGATIVASGGEDAIAELALFVAHDAAITDVADFVHAYPTLVEVAQKAANRRVAAAASRPAARVSRATRLWALRASDARHRSR